MSTVIENQCLLEKIQQQAQLGYQRAAVVVSGEKNWCVAQVNSFIGSQQDASVCWVSNTQPEAIAANNAASQLGKEHRLVVFDAHDDFYVDALGAISGTLCGGGLLFILLPMLDQWLSDGSRFKQHVAKWFDHQAVYLLEQHKPLPDIVSASSCETIRPTVQSPFLSLDQQCVVNAIVDDVIKQKNQPMVLISDRGRGKSSALGLASAYLLQQGIKKIIVTAPRLSISEPVFYHAKRLLPDADYKRGELQFNHQALSFTAPDALLIEKPSADVVLIDEAAALPLPMLEKLLDEYQTIIFSSTIHGYEGTGRGFALKFNQVLDRHSPDWQLHTMQTPIRWAKDDPLEQWIDDILFLHADLVDVPAFEAIDINQCQTLVIDRSHLLNDDAMLLAVFALLVSAHYRTQPSDFQHMLDDENVRIYIMLYQQHVLAVALINQEGGFDENLSSRIYRGERRPKGHLLAQTLSYHAGSERAAELNYARIMRIAVHPELQGKGLGSRLLRQVVESERDKVDAIGSSFGATPDLLRFWQRAEFDVVRMGFTRDHASGCHSAVMLQAFTEQAKQMYSALRQKFSNYLPVWLNGPLMDLSIELKQLLEQDAESDDASLTESDWQEIISFATTHRGYEACMWPLKKLIMQHQSAVQRLNQHEQLLIMEKIQNDKDWQTVAQTTGATGKADVVGQLRKAILTLVASVSNKSAGLPEQKTE
jgi:tRNA(Met) cytidine acetyltransferase